MRTVSFAPSAIAAPPGLARRGLPIVGRVSMDSLTVDATDTTITPGALVDLIGPRNPLDAVAREAGTIGYELLTALGARYCRQYVGG